MKVILGYSDDRTDSVNQDSPPRIGEGVQIDGDKRNYLVADVVHIYSRDQYGRLRHVTVVAELKEIPNGGTPQTDTQHAGIVDTGQG